MRICSKCKKEKSPEEFNFKNKSLKIRQKSCRNCTREEVRNHYSKNKEYYLLKARKRNKTNRVKANKYILNFLTTHPCIDCGEKDPIVLDFDHIRDKIAPVSSIVKNNFSQKKLAEEISKCVVRCANCHRRKTARDFKWYKHKSALVA